MTDFKLTMINGDNRTHETKTWVKWLTEVGKIAAEFDSQQDDCFAYNETASVSILASGAAKADMLSIAEYVSLKKRRKDRREIRNGRCDLWLCSQKLSWAFEFKQFMPYGLPRLETLETKLEGAVEDARDVRHKESDSRFGVLMVSCFYFENKLSSLLERLDEFSQDVDYAWKIESESLYSKPAYFFFRQV